MEYKWLIENLKKPMSVDGTYLVDHFRMDAAAAITDLLARAEAAERERDQLREAMKPNCLLCDSMHPDNGNCTQVGGFCTSVPAAHCPLIPRLMEEADHLKDLLKAAEKCVDDVKWARDHTRPAYVVDEILQKFYAEKKEE